METNFDFGKFMKDMAADLVGMVDETEVIKSVKEVDGVDTVVEETVTKKKPKAYAIINRILLLGGGILIGLFAIGRNIYNPKNKAFQKRLEKAGWVKSEVSEGLIDNKINRAFQALD